MCVVCCSIEVANSCFRETNTGEEQSIVLTKHILTNTVRLISLRKWVFEDNGFDFFTTYFTHIESEKILKLFAYSLWQDGS